MAEDIYSRIDQRLKALGLTGRKVSMKVSGTPDLIRNIKNGKTKSPRGESLVKLANLLQVSPTWLETGEPDHVSSEDVAAALSESDFKESVRSKALLHFKGERPGAAPEVDAKAGAGNGNVGEYEAVFAGDGESYASHRVISEWVFPPPFIRHELRAQPNSIMVIEVIGDSMSPTLESGDRLIVDTAYSRPVPDGIYVIDEGDGPLVKRLQIIRKSDPPKIRVISDNKNHEPYTLTLDGVRIIGRVSGRLSKM
jgi:phage repressor protein C with HTH and peptisase S24 domain